MSELFPILKHGCMSTMRYIPRVKSISSHACGDSFTMS